MARTEFRLNINTMVNDQYGDEFLEGNPDLRHQIQERIKRHLVNRAGRNRRPVVDFLGDTVMSVAVMVPSNVRNAVEPRLDDVPELEFEIAGNRVTVEFEGIDDILDQPAPAGPAAAGAGGPAGGKRRRKATRRHKKRRSTRRH